VNRLLGKLAIGVVMFVIASLFNREDKDMNAIQRQFDEFHDKIKHDEDDERAKLRDKRQVLLDALRAGLDADVPAFESFSQGSYAMRTGVVPLDGNYDIDVGLVFDCNKGKYPDPVALKKKIKNALDTNGRTVNIRRPCVTVNYMRNGKSDYHVDLAVYVKRDDGMLDLAKGKENSATEHRLWELAHPKGLTQKICDRFDGEHAAQYRRGIRYIKRWRDHQFASGAPLSIALTVAAQRWFEPYQTNNGTYLDIVALQNWADVMLNQFSLGANAAGELHERIAIKLPVEPWADLTGWMSKLQMDAFKDRLKALRDALRNAYDETLPEEACKVLSRQFGDEFPIPEKSDTAKKSVAAVISTGHSA
jgi:hypothetical protein